MVGYRLACTGCSFSTVVNGDVEAVYDAIESHQAKCAFAPREDRVGFEVASSH